MPTRWSTCGGPLISRRSSTRRRCMRTRSPGRPGRFHYTRAAAWAWLSTCTTTSPPRPLTWPPARPPARGARQRAKKGAARTLPPPAAPAPQVSAQATAAAAAATTPSRPCSAPWTRTWSDCACRARRRWAVGASGSSAARGSLGPPPAGPPTSRLATAAGGQQHQPQPMSRAARSTPWMARAASSISHRAQRRWPSIRRRPAQARSSSPATWPPSCTA